MRFTRLHFHLFVFSISCDFIYIPALKTTDLLHCWICLNIHVIGLITTIYNMLFESLYFSQLHNFVLYDAFIFL